MGAPTFCPWDIDALSRDMDFYWKPYAQQPTLQLPREGGAKRMKLPVKGFIPYIYANEDIADDHAAPAQGLKATQGPSSINEVRPATVDLSPSRREGKPTEAFVGSSATDDAGGPEHDGTCLAGWRAFCRPGE